MLSIQSLVLGLSDLKIINQQTEACSRNSSLNFCFRCVEDSVNESKNRAAPREDSSVQQVRYLQSWGKYHPTLAWVNQSEIRHPFIWVQTAEIACATREAPAKRMKCRQKISAPPGYWTWEHDTGRSVLNWLVVWGT